MATARTTGVCRYFNTPTGCYNGPACRFRHEHPDQESLATNSEPREVLADERQMAGNGMQSPRIAKGAPDVSFEVAKGLASDPFHEALLSSGASSESRDLGIVLHASKAIGVEIAVIKRELYLKERCLRALQRENELLGASFNAVDQDNRSLRSELARLKCMLSSIALGEL